MWPTGRTLGSPDLKAESEIMLDQYGVLGSVYQHLGKNQPRVSEIKKIILIFTLKSHQTVSWTFCWIFFLACKRFIYITTGKNHYFLVTVLSITSFLKMTMIACNIGVEKYPSHIKIRLYEGERFSRESFPPKMASSWYCGSFSNILVWHKQSNHRNGVRWSYHSSNFVLGSYLSRRSFSKHAFFCA